MKSSKAAVLSKVHRIPDLRYDDHESHQLTSFAGLIVFQKLFADLDLRNRLRGCFNSMKVVPIYGTRLIALLLIVHVILGYRKIRDRDFYDKDPLVLRVLGLRQIPDASTISRTLNRVDDQSVDEMSTVLSDMVVDRIFKSGFRTVTLDFDGSVFSTARHAEGTAIGYNKKKKGQRSYYPLFCTVAQTGQFLDLLHRPGNVHDSNGAMSFVRSNIERIRRIRPGMTVECRFDSAFFDDDLLAELDHDGVEFTVSVPFERFPELKSMIATRSRWKIIDDEWSCFGVDWRPQSWERCLPALGCSPQA